MGIPCRPAAHHSRKSMAQHERLDRFCNRVSSLLISVPSFWKPPRVGACACKVRFVYAPGGVMRWLRKNVPELERCLGDLRNVAGNAALSIAALPTEVLTGSGPPLPKLPTEFGT